MLDAVRAAAPGLCVGVRLSADSQRAAEIAELARRRRASTTSRSRSATRPPTSAPSGSCRRRRSRRPRSRRGRAFAVARAADRHLARRRRRGGRAPARRRPRRGGRDDPRADRRSRAARRKARAGRLARGRPLHRLQRLHRALPRRHAARVRGQPAHRPGAASSARLPRPERSAGESSSSAAGPAGIAAAIEAGRAGHEVVLLERSDRLGGQIALAGAAPGGASSRRAFLEDAERRLAAGGVEVRLVRLGHEPARGRARGRRLSCVATGARGRSGDGGRAARPGTCSPAAARRRRASLVVDWGGDLSGLDAAEVLAAAGKRVTLAVASVAAAESSSTSTGATSTCSGSTGPACRSSTTTSSIAEGGVAAQRLRARSSSADVAGGRRRPRARTRARRGRRAARRARRRAGRRLPLAAVARGGRARGHARGAPRLRVGSRRDRPRAAARDPRAEGARRALRRAGGVSARGSGSPSEARSTRPRSTRSARRAREAGFAMLNMPPEHGGTGLSMLGQVAIEEEAGKATNGLGFAVVDRGPRELLELVTPEQARALRRADRARRVPRGLGADRAGRGLGPLRAAGHAPSATATTGC